jgi:conjugative relaxase-like TrwC/TraI family protein
MDITFSAEKELSTLWLLGDGATRIRIEHIMDEASREAIGYLQTQAAMVRRGNGGLISRSSSGYLALRVDHSTSRPVRGQAAPHLHRHYLLANLAEHEGAWTALDAKPLFNLQKTAGAIASQIIRQRTAELFGVVWLRDEAGIPRIEGFDVSLRNRLSPRTQQILDKAISAGLDVTNRDDWVRAQRTSREGKAACGNDPDAAAWAIDMLLAEGITYDTVMLSLHKAAELRIENHAQALSDRAWVNAHYGPAPVTASELPAWRARVAMGLANHAARGKTGQVTNEVSATAATHATLSSQDWKRLDTAMSVDTRSPSEITDDRAHEALLSVGRKNSTWREKDLLVALADADFALTEARVRASAFLAGPEAVRLLGIDDNPSDELRIRWEDQPVYASSETLEKERRLLAAARDGVGKMGALVTEEQFTEILIQMAARNISISPDSDQYEMLRAFLREANQISLAAGQAGSGKSAGVKAYALALDAGYLALNAGYLGMSAAASLDDVTHLKVVGCALAANAAENLERESEVTAFSIAMLTSRLAAGSFVLDPGAIVIIDEASQASTAQLVELWEYVERADGRLVLTGDPRQMQAVEAGGLYATLINDIPDACTFLDETQRQQNEQERAILACLHDRGELEPRSIAALKRQGVDKKIDLDTLCGVGAIKQWYYANDRIKFHETSDAAAAAIATSYWDKVDAMGGDGAAALVMARSNQEIRLLDHAIVSEAVTRGHLDPTAIVEFGRRSFLVGQRVVTRKIDRAAGVLNGYVGTVQGVETVVDGWGVELSSPSVYATTRTVREKVAVGDTAMVVFSVSRVASERKNAALELQRRTAHLERAQSRLKLTRDYEDSLRSRGVGDKARARLVAARTPASEAKARAGVTRAGVTVKKANAAAALAETLVAERRAQFDAALRWNAWAQTLPLQGGDIEMAVAGVSEKGREERLVIELDDGTKRLLPAKFVEHYVDGGYALTTQRAQGQTVDSGMEYGQISYVGMSRGRQSNEAHLVVPPVDPVNIESERLNLAETHEWLKAKMGPPAADDFLTTSANQLRSGLPNAKAQLGDRLSVTMDVAADVARSRIARDVAQANQLGERRVAVTKTREMAAELSDAVVRELIRAGEGTVLPVKMGDHHWVRNMPVILARGELEGLRHGETYFVSALSRGAMVVETSEGRRVQLTATQVFDQLDSGFAVTSARAQEGTDASSLVVVAAGLCDYDLGWLEEQSLSAEIVLTDPEVGGEHAYYLACDAKVTEILDNEVKEDKRAYSATHLLNNQGEEIGLSSLQAEIRITAGAVDEVRSFEPREVARHDIERDMIGVRRRQRELEDLSRGGDDELAEDREDAKRGLVVMDEQLADLDERYQVITGKVPDSDPAVATELLTSAERHAADLARFAEAEKRLIRYTQARVTVAIKSPRPYHRQLKVDPDLDIAAAEARRQELLVLVEEYRTKWGVSDLNSVLGKTPESGI